MPTLNRTAEIFNPSSRLNNLKLPGSQDSETLEKENAGIGTYLIEILVLVHVLPVAYWVFVLVRQSWNNQQEEGNR
jgi:hypothetical protein